MTAADLIVLGIDPGLSVTGYGLILYRSGKPQALDYGAWRLSRLGGSSGTASALPERLHRLHEAIAQLIAAWHPQEVAVEDFYVGHMRAAVAIGEARAMALLAAAQAGLPVFQYKPLEVKQFVTSYGHGSKEQVQEMLRLLLGLESAPQPEDAADALAVALCHCLKYHSQRKLEVTS